MIDIEEQLAQLRKRVAAIDRKYKTAEYQPKPIVPRSNQHARSFIEEWARGEVVTNDLGSHFQMERLFESHRPHGMADVGALCELPHDLLCVLGGEDIAPASPERWAFLDTETTGLAGGSGTYAFLIGVGRITPKGFAVRQFFMREYTEEASLLAALTEHLRQFDVLITYNGRTYDQPLLETRYRLSRQKPPFSRLPHLDLLYGSRLLWKLRFENCKLTHLERQILGFEREGDIPGEMIPYVYFDFLRSRQAQQLVPVFHHNALDILTLGCLTAIVPSAFRRTDEQSLARLGLRCGEELLGIARWLLAAGDYEQGLTLLKRAVDRGLSDALLFRALWDIAMLEKKLARPQAALSLLNELASCRNAFRVQALEELAKHNEHNERNYVVALELTQQAQRLAPSESLSKRHERLHRKMRRR